MDEESEYEHVSSILNGTKGCKDEYSEISKFKEHLNEASLEVEKLNCGSVLWRADGRQQHHDHDDHSTELQHRIKTLLNQLIHKQNVRADCLVQFWAIEVKGRHHYLSTSNQPFCVSYLCKGLSWYRKRCVGYVYDVVEEERGEEKDEQELGGVGRAYKNKHPESTPDLRLYSTNEFPLRDHAARCGLKGYLALPVFGIHNNKCYGVLELLSSAPILDAFLLCSLDQRLQIAELRFTHINFIPIKRCSIKMADKYKQQPESEIEKILVSAILGVPELRLAQVWVLCKQCAYKNTKYSCMERVSFINAQDKKVNMYDYADEDMLAYLHASEFHNLQTDLSNSHQNLFDLGISKNSLAHYAQKARLSFCVTFFLKSVHMNNNDFYVIEFFLQRSFKEDASSDSSMHLLPRIVEMHLKNFKIALEGQLTKELRQPNAVECEPMDMLKVMDSYEEILSELNFTKYLETTDLLGQRLSSKGNEFGWVFCRPSRDGLHEIDVDSESVHVPITVEEKIKLFMKKIALDFRPKSYSMAQFWASKIVNDRCYLETLYQPCALGYLAKGLASFRKKCMEHYYFVDDEAKEEELGPPGRVFRSGHPEISPDLFLYTTTEFLLRDHAVHCCFTKYFVIPVFDEDKHSCVGVLEFIGFKNSELCNINAALKAVKLHSTHIDFVPRFLANNEKEPDITSCRNDALNEIRNAFYLITKIPQLHMANVWVPYGECAFSNSNIIPSCMELALISNSMSAFMPTHVVNKIHVQPKKGILGTVLTSQSKSCFCRNICDFGIVALAHYRRRERNDACFAICLQSSLTGDLVYVLEFFLYQGPTGNLKSFLSFLLPIMKEKLITFKVASGKHLEEKLVVEVIEFSEANNIEFSEANNFTSSASDLQNVPFEFITICYSQNKHQYTEEQHVPSVSNSTQTDQHCSASTSDFKKTEKGKRKGSFNPSFELLQTYFGMTLDDAAKKLKVSKSTLKRAKEELGISRWPHTENQARKFERESARHTQQDMQPSSNSNLLQLDASIQQNVTYSDIESSQHLIVQEEAKKVIMKVRNEEDLIKFEFCLSQGVGKLFEEVATRLDLSIGSFKLKYVDEDNEEVRLTCDTDFQLCPKSMTSTGKTCIELKIK